MVQIPPLPLLEGRGGIGKMELGGFLSALFSVNFGNEICVSQVLLGVAVMNIFGEQLTHLPSASGKY